MIDDQKDFNFLDKKRLLYVFVFVFFLFCLLIFWFFKIQILEKDVWQKRALKQHEKLLKIPFKRGRFFSNTQIKDNHPNFFSPIVQDVAKYHLFIDPEKIPIAFKEEISEKLLKFFNLKLLEKQNFLKQFYIKKRKRRLVKWISKEKHDQITLWWKTYYKKNKITSNSLFFELDFKRSYPFGSLLGQVLHTVQEEKEPGTSQAIPTGGLELYFNELLKGSFGLKKIYRSPKNELRASKIIKPSVNGADIYLTINHYLQAIAEEELERGVKRANAKGGWAVLMDPFTGEVLSLAQYPFFDLEKFGSYFQKETKQNPQGCFLEEHTRVKAITDSFEPASIFKPIALAALLKANEKYFDKHKKHLFYPDEKIETRNGVFKGRSRPLKDGRRHNFLNMYMAVQKSSNIYMGKVTDKILSKISDKWYRETLKSFGFGTKTGVEIPAESGGLLPEIGKMHPNGKPQWSLATPYSLAIGHNILTNSMQIAKIYASIANGGYEIKPTLIKKIIKDDKLIFSQKKQKLNKKIFSQRICDELICAMKFVTKLGGSSRLGDIYGYTEAGKSGTSEKIINGTYSKEKYIASFVGIAPATNPRFVLLISIDEPEKTFVKGVGKMHHGGVCASYVFKNIATRSLQYLGVKPDDPSGYPYGDPRRNYKNANWNYEVDLLKDLYIKWNK
jgi:cell division protein FtsI (penicillin-binding protein 3)